MKLNKYALQSLDNAEVLIYTMGDELSMPLDDLGLTLIQENPILEENQFIPILKAEDLLERILKHSRTRDVVLAEEGIDNWNKLQVSYYCLKNLLVYYPKRMREFINEKYSEIINNYDYIHNNSLDSSDDIHD